MSDTLTDVIIPTGGDKKIQTKEHHKDPFEENSTSSNFLVKQKLRDKVKDRCHFQL